MNSPVIAVLGLGEAGGRFAADLVAAGAEVRGFDPQLGPPPGVTACTGDADACTGADLVISVNSAHDALDALTQSLPAVRSGTIWADFNTSAPGLKQELARVAGDAVRVVDVAVMAPVPPTGLRTPLTVSGPASDDAAGMLRALGAHVEVIDGPVGQAATRKLLRSVFYKGLAAAVVEALEAARAAGLEEWLTGNIRSELERSNPATLDRLVSGSHTHAVRRREEMAAAADLLGELGVPPRIAAASRDWLADLAARRDSAVTPRPPRQH
jgi:3-hydroxyisobutyrate dehydrogenase-like beta-hydroxyacid dehydrogenase